MKKVLLYALLGIFLLLLLITLIGLLLPKERIETRQILLNANPEAVYKIVTNNNNWNYRSGLKELKIIQKKRDWENWEETTPDGTIIKFKTREKKPYTLYSFDMQSNLFTGYWIAEFKPIENQKTLFIATEHIQIKNPFIKTLSYIFFDIGKLLENYLQDLETKINNKL